MPDIATRRSALAAWDAAVAAHIRYAAVCFGAEDPSYAEEEYATEQSNRLYDRDCAWVAAAARAGLQPAAGPVVATTDDTAYGH